MAAVLAFQGALEGHYCLAIPRFQEPAMSDQGVSEAFRGAVTASKFALQGVLEGRPQKTGRAENGPPALFDDQPNGARLGRPAGTRFSGLSASLNCEQLLLYC